MIIRRVAAVVFLLMSFPALSLAGEVTIDSITVTELQKDQLWKVEIKGKLTLEKGETLKGFKCTLTDPNGKTVGTFIDFVPPQGGQSNPYTAFTNVNVKGFWSVDSGMLYTLADGSPGLAAIGKGFNVPAK